MKIERKDLDKSRVELIVEEKVENIKKLRALVLKDIEQNADIKGFRKWAKIPEAVLVKEFGEERINSMVIEKAIDTMYRESLKKEKIIPVAQWEIKEILSENPLKIKIEIEVLPQVEIKDGYKSIKLKKQKIEVKESEVKWALEDIEKKFTKFEEITDKKSKLKMWDRATVDTQGYDLKWKELENTDMKNYPLVLGANILVPGFEEQLVGAKLWDELEIEVEFPKDYHNAGFSGKKTKFKVKINKFERAVKPEFTPEFIESLRGKKLDLDGFKKLIQSEIQETKEANARIEEEQKLISELLKYVKIDMWDKLVAEQTNRVFEEVKNNMSQQWIKMSDYLESLKLSEPDYKEKHLKQTALTRLQGELILAKLAQIEKVSIDDATMKKEIEKIISEFQAKDVVARLKELYVPGNQYYEELKQRMVYRAIIDSFFV